ncbi:hydrogenase maturation protease [Sedimentibacter sp. B4]|uniref:hydrogenase maturation protease n=1 Tax=Sedimentibacter sp. B4 TaxID=304766 RepID=UPI0002ED9ACA|nr:hydrogenase maturation protease [Sedimentibacter sp. B4]
MAVKCIAIGNRIMGDDAIGIKVTEELTTKLIKEDIVIIYGETDNEYALSKIKDGDLLFIIDSTYLDLMPGTVTVTSINDLSLKNNLTSQHQPSLIHLIKLYGKNINGFVIGIEVDTIEFSSELSNTLKLKFHNICQEVYEFIVANKNK